MNKELSDTPGDKIREELQSRGWTQADLAQILGRPLAAVNEVIQGKRSITPEMAVALGSAFGNGPGFWMQLDVAYRLTQVDDAAGDVVRRARLFHAAPVKEMQRRGWLPKVERLDDLERELCRFFEIESLDQVPQISAATRRSAPAEPMNTAQRAWCFRAKQLAKLVQAGSYSSRSFQRAVRDLRKIAARPDEVGRVSRVLASAGIRFVVVEQLPQSRIDGATFWLDQGKPVVALSLRFDRIDSFWHTLGHELSHIHHRDGLVVDTDLIGADSVSPAEKPAIELRADREAAATWIDPQVLDDFISRVGPLYSRAKINQFANRIRIHPGIIIGQLQHRGELSFGSMRSALVKVRDIVLSETLTDGWGHTTQISH